MAITEKYQCEYLYRKPGQETAHCTIQRDKGLKWDFCKYQYLCRNTKRYETTKDVDRCPIRSQQ